MIDDRIVDYKGRGVHIPITCKNHPKKRWSTKNIEYIGARTVFYNLHNVPGMGPECECKLSDLRPLTTEELLNEVE